MSEPRWLDAAQQRAWRGYVDGSSQLAERLERELRERHDLSMAEYEILVRLSEAPEGRLRMAELASCAHQSRSRLSHTIRRLQNAGMVRRESCPQDRRGVFAVLTREGLRRLELAAPDHVASVRDCFVDVVEPADLAAIGRAFRTVADRLSEQS